MKSFSHIAAVIVTSVVVWSSPELVKAQSPSDANPTRGFTESLSEVAIAAERVESSIDIAIGQFQDIIAIVDADPDEISSELDQQFHNIYGRVRDMLSTLDSTSPLMINLMRAREQVIQYRRTLAQSPEENAEQISRLDEQLARFASIQQDITDGQNAIDQSLRDILSVRRRLDRDIRVGAIDVALTQIENTLIVDLRGLVQSLQSLAETEIDPVETVVE